MSARWDGILHALDFHRQPRVGERLFRQRHALLLSFEGAGLVPLLLPFSQHRERFLVGVHGLQVLRVVVEVAQHGLDVDAGGAGANEGEDNQGHQYANAHRFSFCAASARDSNTIRMCVCSPDRDRPVK